MTRSARVRTRVRGSPAGTRQGTWAGVPRDVVQFAPSAYNETCQDSHGRPVAPSPFNVELQDRSHYEGYSYTRFNPANGDKVVWKDYWYSFQLSGTISHLSTTSPNAAALGATIRSRTNPSRPVVAPLSIVQNVVELPKMLREVGHLLRTPKSLLSPRQLANYNLGAQFGWLPLINDVKTLLHTGDHLQSRLKEIDSLFSSGGLGRRIRLGEEHVHQGQTLIMESELLSVVGTHSRDTSQKVWGTCRWKPTTPPNYHPSNAAKLRAAQAIVSGFTPDGLLKGAWDLLPWTWMVDWFSNTGDWLSQNSMFLPATSTETCLMRERNTLVQHSVSLAPKGHEDHGGYGILSTKNRVIATGSLAAYIPKVDARRLSVLGSLFVQRFKR